MNRLDIIRAWKDEEYRGSLDEAQRTALPENPAGLVELNAEQLENAVGGKPLPSFTIACWPKTFNVSCQRTFLVVCPRTLAVAVCPVTTTP